MSSPNLDVPCPASPCGTAAAYAGDGVGLPPRPCAGDGAGILPRHGPERTAMLVLRFIAAAHETGDACCWDVAFELAEAAFGEDAGPLVVARAGGLIRRLSRAGNGFRFLPPPCRRLSADEALILAALGARPRAAVSRFDLAPVAEALAAFAASIVASDEVATRRAA